MRDWNQIVLNTASVLAPPKKAQQVSVVFNLKGPKVRFETLEGRQYMVVPMVMLTEGVHTGNQGPLYYPGEELSKTPVAWNMKPIVVYHPQVNGVGVSACTPEVINTRKIGLVMGATYEGNALKAEAWLDPERTKAVDDRILTKIDKGEMVELSTGLFVDHEDAAGEWKGEKYVAIARNYRADHLAVLPDQIGACSIKDGAGLLRNAVSYEQISGLLRTALQEKYPEGYCYVEAVFDTFLIYQHGSELYQQKYTTTDTSATLVGEPVEVVKVIQYRTPDGSVVGNKEWTDVNKAAMIALLLANSAGVWTEKDKGWLETQDEMRLRQLTANLKEEKKVEEKKDTPAPTPTPVGNTQPTPTPAPPKNPTFQDYINNAPPEVRDMLASSVRMHENERKRLIGVITNHARNTFKAETLVQKTLEELQAIAAFATPVENREIGGFAMPSFLGLGDVNGTPTANTEECLELPVMNFGKDGK